MRTSSHHYEEFFTDERKWMSNKRIMKWHLRFPPASEYGIRFLLLQSFWTLLIYLCTVESSWQFLKELHHKDIMGLQLCPTYTKGTQRHFLVPFLISLWLIFGGFWKVLRKMSTFCIFRWFNTFENPNGRWFWSNTFLLYKLVSISVTNALMPSFY